LVGGIHPLALSRIDRTLTMGSGQADLLRVPGHGLASVSWHRL